MPPPKSAQGNIPASVKDAGNDSLQLRASDARPGKNGKREVTAENSPSSDVGVSGSHDIGPVAKPPQQARTPKPKGTSREHVAYWKAMLRKCRRTGNYTVQIAFKGRRGTFTFGRDATAAAEKARQIYLSITSRGLDPVGRAIAWRETLQKYSHGGFTRLLEKEQKAAKQAHEESVAGRIEKPTVGDLIRVAGELSTARLHTVHGYAKALRFIVSEVFDIRDTEEMPISRKKSTESDCQAAQSPSLIRIKKLRYDYRAGGREKWRASVDSIPLERLTPAEVQRWRKTYLARAGSDPVALDRARVTFNKLMRNARALFSRKILPFLETRMILPRPLFYEGVAKEQEPPMRYRSKIDPAAILRDAADQLSSENPEAFKALFLCLVLGLRRSEADTLLWANVDFDRREVSIKPTEHNMLKSRDSAREIALDDMSMGLFRGWKAKAKGVFVLESPRKPKPLARTPEYRCMKTFDALTSWLRSKGITAGKPIHELRKECGTLLLKQGQPIEAVSRYLGHSSIQITMAHYADIAKQRAAVNMAALFQVTASNPPLAPEEASTLSFGTQSAVSA